MWIDIIHSLLSYHNHQAMLYNQFLNHQQPENQNKSSSEARIIEQYVCR